MSLGRSLGNSEVNRTLPLPSKNSLFCLGTCVNERNYDAKWEVNE